jgi:hypothetical protein
LSNVRIGPLAGLRRSGGEGEDAASVVVAADADTITTLGG